MGTSISHPYRWNAATATPGAFSARPSYSVSGRVQHHAAAAARPQLELPSDVNSRFGRRLRELRHQHALTQLDMSKRFGIDRSYISDVERGRKSISLPILEIIAIGLGLSLSDLFQNV
jgi:DNA-binding XRE family transcriptional regulator